MRSITKRVLGRLFPLMALTGFLLAGYGLLVTPDELQADHDMSRLISLNLE